jgi:hypothetical protein
VRKGEAYRQRLINFNNVQYVGDITVGNQELGALYDTGSDKLVLSSTECRTCTRPVPPYNHKQSQSYHLSGVYHTITYGAGSVDVMRGLDTVSVGPLKADKQEIWEITKCSMQVAETAAYAAMVGMSPVPNSGYKNGDYLAVSLGVEAFSYCLGRAGGSDGYMTWNAPRAGSGVHPAANVLSQTDWIVRMNKVTLSGNSNVELCGASDCHVVMDTGMSLIEGPMTYIMELSNHINIKPDCSNLNELPTLKFELDGQPIELPPHAYVVRLTGDPMDEKRVWPFLPTGGVGTPFQPNTCHPAFVMGGSSSDELGPLWVIGMPFFRYYSTTFDRGANKMSFAPAGSNCDEASNASGSASFVEEHLAPVELNMRDLEAMMRTRRARTSKRR